MGSNSEAARLFEPFPCNKTNGNYYVTREKLQATGVKTVVIFANTGQPLVEENFKCLCYDPSLGLEDHDEVNGDYPCILELKGFKQKELDKAHSFIDTVECDAASDPDPLNCSVDATSGLVSFPNEDEVRAFWATKPYGEATVQNTKAVPVKVITVDPPMEYFLEAGEQADVTGRADADGMMELIVISADREEEVNESVRIECTLEI